MRRRKYSRLAKKEEARNLHRATLFIIFTILLLVGIFVFGLPLITKMAVFLGDLKGSALPVEKEDIIPPTPPVLDSLPEATKKQIVEIKGYAESESKIEIYLNEVKKGEVLASQEGTFSFSNLKLEKGKNVIYARATDKEGNTSQISRKLTITFDIDSPSLTILEPQDNAQFFWPDEEVVIKGEAEPGVTVTINGRMTVVSQEGKFQYSHRLTEGENLLTIITTDKAENSTETTLHLNYSL